MSHPVTTTDLAALIAPFVGKRLRGDLSASIEIEAPGQCFVNADVRGVAGGYVEVFFYRGCDFIPLANIRRIVVRGKDDEGNYTSEARYEQAGQRAKAAA